MDALLGKLTNLGYELFGVVIPGLITTILLVLLWYATGDLVSVWSFGAIPKFDTGALQGWTAKFVGLQAWVLGGGILTVCYFLGHAMTWLAQSRNERLTGKISKTIRFSMIIRFKTPKPQHSYEPGLKPLFDYARTVLGGDAGPLDWRSFYPVAKTMIAQRAGYSLIATYQNKYTLHRALAFASAVIWWGCILVAVGACATLRFCAVEAHPHWLALLLLFVGSTVSVSGFAGSYMYFWGLFGDAIVTEAYVMQFAAKPQKAESVVDH